MEQYMFIDRISNDEIAEINIENEWFKTRLVNHYNTKTCWFLTDVIHEEFMKNYNKYSDYSHFIRAIKDQFVIDIDYKVSKQKSDTIKSRSDKIVYKISYKCLKILESQVDFKVMEYYMAFEDFIFKRMYDDFESQRKKNSKYLEKINSKKETIQYNKQDFKYEKKQIHQDAMDEADEKIKQNFEKLQQNIKQSFFKWKKITNKFLTLDNINDDYLQKAESFFMEEKSKFSLIDNEMKIILQQIIDNTFKVTEKKRLTQWLKQTENIYDGKAKSIYDIYNFNIDDDYHDDYEIENQYEKGSCLESEIPWMKKQGYI